MYGVIRTSPAFGNTGPVCYRLVGERARLVTPGAIRTDPGILRRSIEQPKKIAHAVHGPLERSSADRRAPTLAGVSSKIVSVAAVVAAAVPMAGLVGCSQTNLTTEDAYKIGCPTIDATVASGQVANDVAVTTLKEVRDRAHPSKDTKKWLNAAIGVLTSDHPTALSRQTKKLIIKGCKENGYPLQNLH